MPEISIVIPIYNAEEYVENCVKSILNQTFQNFEIILVNDGSVDKSVDICQKYVEQDKRISFIDQSNQGVSVARNQGKNKAIGNYILFVDADDELHPMMLEVMLRQAENQQADVVVCGVNKVLEVPTLDEQIESRDFEILSAMQATESLLKGQKVESGVWNKIFRRELLDKIDFCVGKRINEDKYFVFQAFLRAKTVIYVPAKMYYYIQRDNSATNQKFSDRWFDMLYFAEKIYTETEKVYPELKDVAMFAHLQSQYTVLRYMYPYRRKYKDRYFKICDDIKKADITTIQQYLSSSQKLGIWCIKYFPLGYWGMRILSRH